MLGSDHYEMALLFWREGKNQISSALFAVIICNAYCEMNDIDSTKYSDLKKMSSNFQDLACQLLQICTDSDKIKTEQMLQSRITEFSDTTPIQLALTGQALDFVGHDSFQNLIIKKWHDRVLPITSNLYLFLSIFMPFFVLFIYFEEEEEEEEKAVKSKKKFLNMFKNWINFINTPLIKFILNHVN